MPTVVVMANLAASPCMVQKHDDGRYLDIIARGNRLSNDYKLYSVGGQRVNGDYHTYGTSLSAEYGKRIKKKNEASTSILV